MWFRDYDGNLLEIKVAEKSSPNEKTRFSQMSIAADERGAPFRSTMPRTRPRRLTHVLLFTPDVPRAIEFYTHVLGMRLSDYSGDKVAFLHGIHGSDHHMIAFAHSDAPGHHHFSWDVGSVDEIGAGAMHMLDKGFSKGWGLGRHVLGSNYFHYVQDPWGSFSEYAADIDYISATCDWKGGDHPPEDSSTPGGPTCPRISSIITKRDPAEPKLVADRTAIDIDRLTGNECAGVGGEKDSGTTDRQASCRV